MKPPVTLYRLLVLVMLCTILAPAAHAEHEADHRYVVFGTVLDADQRPVANRLVQVHDGGTLLQSATTGSDGRYRMQLHFHDEDLGRRLTVSSGDRRAEIVVSFTRGDKTTSRSHRVDFGADAVRDVRQAGSGYVIPPALYYVGAVIAIVVLLSFAARVSKRKAQKARHDESHAGSKKRRRKRR